MNLRTFNPFALLAAALGGVKHRKPAPTPTPKAPAPPVGHVTPPTYHRPIAPVAPFYGYKATPKARNQRRRDRASVRAFVLALNRARG